VIVKKELGIEEIEEIEEKETEIEDMIVIGIGIEREDVKEAEIKIEGGDEVEMTKIEDVNGTGEKKKEKYLKANQKTIIERNARKRRRRLPVKNLITNHNHNNKWMICTMKINKSNINHNSKWKCHNRWNHHLTWSLLLKWLLHLT